MKTGPGAALCLTLMVPGSAFAGVPVIDFLALGALKEIRREIETVHQRVEELGLNTVRLLTEGVGTPDAARNYRQSLQARSHVKEVVEDGPDGAVLGDPRPDGEIHQDRCPRQPDEWQSFDQARSWAAHCFFIDPETQMTDKVGNPLGYADRVRQTDRRRQVYLRHAGVRAWAYTVWSRKSHPETERQVKATWEDLGRARTLRDDLAAVAMSGLLEAKSASEANRLLGQQLELQAMELVFTRSPALTDEEWRDLVGEDAE